MTRVVDADAETDAALLEAAESGTAADLARLAAYWEALADQDDPRAAAAGAWERRGLRRRSRSDGLDVELVLTVADAERLLSVLDTVLRREPVEKAPAGATTALEPVRSWSQKRADALVDLVECGLEHLDEAGAVEADRALVNVLVDYDRLVADAREGIAEVAGRPVTGEAARRLCCDAGLVRIVTWGRSEVLDVGRKTRKWSPAQRRAIIARHGGRGAAPGCERRVVQIHHTDPWAHHGATDVAAGVPLCFGHHRLVQELGWTVHYDAATGTTSFTNPGSGTTMAA